jgi:hypothetical protein
MKTLAFRAWATSLLVLMVCIMILFAPLFGLAQSALPQESTTPAFSLAPRHHAGWVASYAGGTPTLGRGSLMLTTFYSHTVSETLDIEGALSYLGLSERWCDVAQAPQIAAYHSTSWTGDVTFFWKPFSGAGRRFHVGVGPSLHWQFFGAPTTIFYSNGQSLSYLDHRELAALGGNFKIEYCIPVSGAFDIGMRGQIHAFLPSFVGRDFPYPSSASASIGLFLRGNW